MPSLQPSPWAGFGLSDAELAAFDLDGVVREHRRRVWQRRLIADVEDHIGTLPTWPYAEQRLVLARSGDRRDVFRFVLFSLGNRAPPRPVVALLLGLGLLRTLKCRRDCWDAVRGFRDGTHGPDAFYWDLEANARARVHGPESWCGGGVPRGMRDPTFWADAERMLTGRSCS